MFCHGGEGFSFRGGGGGGVIPLLGAVMEVMKVLYPLHPHPVGCAMSRCLLSEVGGSYQCSGCRAGRRSGWWPTSGMEKLS